MIIGFKCHWRGCSRSTFVNWWRREKKCHQAYKGARSICKTLCSVCVQILVFFGIESENPVFSLVIFRLPSWSLICSNPHTRSLESNRSGYILVLAHFRFRFRRFGKEEETNLRRLINNKNLSLKSNPSQSNKVTWEASTQWLTDWLHVRRSCDRPMRNVKYLRHLLCR